jgi:hypothetical protein
LATVYIFTLIFIYFALLGYGLNSKSVAGDVFIYGLFSVLFLWFSWFTFHAMFRFRLEIDQNGGRFCGFGNLISFRWEDAHAIDYIYQPWNYYHLCLYVTPNKIHHGIRWLHAFFIFKFFDTLILLDTVRKYEPFVTRGMGDTLPSYDELSLHLRYFLRTQLGNDLIRYAPHLFGNVLSKYLPDDDFDFRGR